MSQVGLFPRFARPVCGILCSVAVAAFFGTVVRGQSAPGAPVLGQAGKDVSWVPSPDALVDQMFQMARLSPTDYLIDLGSGDGKIVIAAAQRGVRALGVEYDAQLVELAKQRAAADHLADRASFLKADLFETDLSQATVITLFLLPELNLKLRPLLLGLKPGTRIVSNTFTMDDWDADATTTVGLGCLSWCTALMWVIPANVAGTWVWPQGKLTLQQKFQMLTGKVQEAGRSPSITDGRMHGDSISFTAGGARYAGRVEGDAIMGTVSSREGSHPWTASRRK